MARLPIALMNGGRLEGRQVLPEAVVTALLTSRVDVPERPEAATVTGSCSRRDAG